VLRDFCATVRRCQAELKSQGFAVDYFQVAGRGSSAQNAVRLAEHFRATASDARPIIVFAYSKGLVDLLEFMVRYPDEARQIAAVVAVAGAANGSPLADQMHAVYRAVGAPFPLPNCAPGTGVELIDLQPDVRIAWWQQHGESITVPVFALVAAPEPDRVSPATRATYRQLAKVDARNDGKLLWQDQIPRAVTCSATSTRITGRSRCRSPPVCRKHPSCFATRRRARRWSPVRSTW